MWLFLTVFPLSICFGMIDKNYRENMLRLLPLLCRTPVAVPEGEGAPRRSAGTSPMWTHHEESRICRRLVAMRGVGAEGKPVQITGAGSGRGVGGLNTIPIKIFVSLPFLGTLKIFFTWAWTVLCCPDESPLPPVGLKEHAEGLSHMYAGPCSNLPIMCVFLPCLEDPGGMWGSWRDCCSRALSWNHEPRALTVSLTGLLHSTHGGRYLLEIYLAFYILMNTEAESTQAKIIMH